MASWEPALRRAVAQAAGGRDIIEKFDHDKKVIEIKPDVANPTCLRNIEAAGERLAFGYEVVQST